MEKSLFAGLTILDPDESILEDNGAFTKRDRQTIDRFLEIGAKTHRHDGTDGLSNPPSPMDGTAVASAGQIPADIAFSLGYTLEDDQGGETLLSPLVTLSTPSVIEPPTFAPDGAADYSAGDLLTDTYYYAYSYIDGDGGETTTGPTVAVEREPGYANGRVLLSGLSVGLASAGAYGWNVYRAVGGGDLHLLASGTGDTYTDDGSDSVNCDIGPLSEEINTTNGDNTIVLVLPSADAYVAESDFINVYMSEDGTFSGDVLIDQFPVSSAGASVVYNSLEFLEGQPPDTNSSIGGASLIDPDTELLDWHWKRPVASAGALPEPAEEGDARVTLNDGTIYVYHASAWAAAVGGGGGGGSGAVMTRGPHIWDTFGAFVSEWEYVENGPSGLTLGTDVLEGTPGGEVSRFDVLIGQYSPGMVSARIHTGSATSGGAFGVCGAVDHADPTDRIRAYVVTNGGSNYHLQVLGGGGVVDTSADFTLDPDTDYWIALYLQDDLATARLYDGDPYSAPSTVEELVDVDISAYPHATGDGGAGIHFYPPDPDWYLDDFKMRGIDPYPFGPTETIGIRGSAGIRVRLAEGYGPDGDSYGQFTISGEDFVPEITLREDADPGSLSNAHSEKTGISKVRYASGTGVRVTLAGGTETGEARVVFGLVAGSASGSVHQVQGSGTEGGGSILEGYERIVFEASGGASVGVAQVPGRKWAKVTIGAASAAGGGGGGGGMGASALLDVTDEDGPLISDIAQLQFRASGSATVGVNDLGGGVAEVVVSASAAAGPAGPQGDTGPEGPQGPAGAGGARHQTAGSAGVDQVYDDGYTEFRASGGLSVGTSDIGTGASAAVTIAPLGRRWASASVTLASGASGVVDFTGSAAGGRLLKISTSKRARVRMYGDTVSRAADAGRSLTDAYDSLTDGVLLDYQMAVASGSVKKLSPAVDAHNLEEPPANKQYLSVTNYDDTGSVVVAFLYLPLEVV